MMGVSKYLLSATIVAVSTVYSYITFAEVKGNKPVKQIDDAGLHKTYYATCHGYDGKPTEWGVGLGSQNFTDPKHQYSTTDEKMIKQTTEGSPYKMILFKDTLKGVALRYWGGLSVALQRNRR